MLLNTLFLLFTAAMTLVSADNQGSYTVPGLGKRKQQIMRHGGQVLATAMLETDTLTTNYTDGDGKSGDSAHFGIFQQNWLMLRTFFCRVQASDGCRSQARHDTQEEAHEGHQGKTGI